MTAITKYSHGEDQIYEATAVVDGGQLVIASGSATNAGLQGIAPAGAGSAVVLGVAARRAEPVANQNLSATDGDGYPVVYPNPVNELTAVYKRVVAPVVYTAVAVAYGVKLKSAASGAVAAWVSGTDAAALIVGECRVVGGMGAGGGVGLAYIY